MARILLGVLILLVLGPVTDVFAARPKVAPPVALVAKALGVELTNAPHLDDHQKTVARAAGQRLVSLCPDCRPSTIHEEGPCGWARANRNIIKSAVAAGKDEETIVKTYVTTYGAQVLAIDKSSGFASASWSVPMALILLSLGFVIVMGKRWSAQPVPVPVKNDRRPASSSTEAEQILRRELDELD